jgi:hypothetical protein
MSAWASPASAFRQGSDCAASSELAQLWSRSGDATLWDQPWFREKLAANVEIELKALEITQLRVIAEARKRGAMASRTRIPRS